MVGDADRIRRESDLTIAIIRKSTHLDNGSLSEYAQLRVGGRLRVLLHRNDVQMERSLCHASVKR